MNGIFKRGGGAGRRSWAESGQPRLALAAFGKHPGWDDHIPGIGVETEALAHAKQSLYVSGIGGQIDSGAWEKLEPEKRLEGFDHTFLWLREEQVLIGQLWSSTDRKGRAKYPMVICAGGENVSPGFMVTKVRPELERLREACRAATTTEQVTQECARSQGRLRELLADPGQTPTASFQLAGARQRFLEHPALGPDRVGVLRVLHELGVAQARSSGGTVDVRPRHLRLPLASDLRNESLLMWSAFLRRALGNDAPVLLLARDRIDWLDALVGEPTSDDFFCMQASVKALPLATEIPYDLAPELQTRLQALETEFGGGPGGTTVATPVAAPQPATPPVVSVGPAVAESGAPRKGGKWGLFLIGGAVILASGAGWWFLGRNDGSTLAQSGTEAARSRDQTTNAQAAGGQPLAATQAKAGAEARVREEMRQKSETEAARIAAEKQSAEKVKPEGDAKAREEARLKAEVEAKRIAEEKRLAEEKAKAETEAKAKEVARLKAEAEQKQMAEAKARQLEEEYQVALKEGQAAFDRKDFKRALAQAEAALRFKPGDAAATLAKARAEEALGLQSAQNYFDQGDYVKASELCGKHPGVEAFSNLAGRVTAEQKALDDARQKFAAGDYSLVVGVKSQSYGEKPPFAELLKQVASEKAVLDELDGLKQAGNWQSLGAKLAEPASTSFKDKSPFAALRQWADTQAAQGKKKQELEQINQEYQRLLVEFNVVKRTDSRITDPEVRRTAERLDGRLPQPDINAYLDRIKMIEATFKENGMLDADRKKMLGKLAETIRYR